MCIHTHTHTHTLIYTHAHISTTLTHIYSYPPHSHISTTLTHISTTLTHVDRRCTADISSSKIVPIAVGAALAGLVVVVLVAYLIGRFKNRKQNSYEALS